MGITTSRVKLETSGVAKQFSQHGLRIPLRIVTYIIWTGMSGLVGSDQITHLEIMSLLTRITPGGITTYIECSVLPTPRKPMLNSLHAIFTKDSTCFNIFPTSWATSPSPACSIQSSSPCLTTLRWGFLTSWRRTHGMASSMQFNYLSLLTRISQQQ